MKKLLIITMLVITTTLTAQDDKWFLSAGFDPAISFDLKKTDGQQRVGGGNLNYLLQFGRERYEADKIGYKFGIQWEQFKAINYTSYGVFGGITFQSPYIPFTEIGIGDFWYVTAEINMIDRKGIQNSQLYNADELTNWVIGANFGVTFQKIFNLPINFDLLLNAKDRADIRSHYTGGKFDSLNDIVISGYFLLTVNF